PPQRGVARARVRPPERGQPSEGSQLAIMDQSLLQDLTSSLKRDAARRFGYEEPGWDRARPSTPERSVSFERALPIADNAPTSFAHPSGWAKYSTSPAAIST